MMRMDYSTMHLFKMSHEERNRLLEVSLTYYRLHLPDFPEMKSVCFRNYISDYSNLIVPWMAFSGAE